MTHYKDIRKNVDAIAKGCGRDPQDVGIVVVTKYQTIDSMKEAYKDGVRDFGENRLQEAMGKIQEFPDINWHLIGTLQSNKVSKVMGLFSLIHSVDTLALAEKISRECERQGREQRILLQVNTSGEASKHGMSPEEWRRALSAVLALPHIRIEGLMTMAPLVENKDVIRLCFKKLRLLNEEFRSVAKDSTLFKHLSMGMSHDYPIAIEEGATLLRIGSAIFVK